MKIVFLSRYQATTQRGVEVFVSELTSRLSKQHKVDIFWGDRADSLGEILRGKYDIVVPTNGRLQSLKVSLARPIGRYKILISGHSGIGRDDIWNIAVTKPDVFVALTDYMADWAKKWAWGSKVIKISNGIDLNKFSPSGKKIDLGLPKPIILSVGALTWYKHHERAIESVAKLTTGSLLIVGRGEEKGNLERLGREKLGKRFRLMSAEYEQLSGIYRSVNLFTLPSWDREAFGIVYLEAMASGLPVVAPNDLSRREIIGDGGILVDVSSAKNYAEAIEKALSFNWQNKPRSQAAKFSWDVISKKYEEVFLTLAHE